MLAIRPDGTAADLPTIRRCLPGRLADSYLARARSRPERRRRVRHLASFACFHVLGISSRAIADLFDVSEWQIRQELRSTRADLAVEARELGIDVNALFRRPARPDEEDDEP